MMFPKKGINQQAKELSKTNKGPVEEAGSYGRGANKVGPRSYKRDLPVSSVKENGSKSIVKGTTSYNSEGGYYSDSKSPGVNRTPEKGQSNKTVRTYEGGKLRSVEKQGTDILGRPKSKVKTYGDDSKVYKEKKTLVGGKIKNRDYPLAESNF